MRPDDDAASGGGLGRMFQRRSIESLQTDAQTSGLPRTLSALNLILLGIGCIVGAGIYVLPGLAAAHFAGPGVVLSFLLAGAACALLLARGAAQVYTDYLWYAALGATDVWRARYGALRMPSAEHPQRAVDGMPG